MLKSIIFKLKSLFIKDPMEILQENIFSEVTRALSLSGLNFPSNFKLPVNYGIAMPERVVEVFLAAISFKAGLRVLDVGHANAMTCHLKMVESLPKPSNIIGIDIAKPVYDTRPYYRQSIMGDITNTPFPDETFDLIWCISALEHFGMDNSGYTEKFTRDEEMDVRALKEMLRILAQGGGVLITVPFGKFEDHGWLKNYDECHVNNLISVAKECDTKAWYFKYHTEHGWSMVSPLELRGVGYFDESNCGSAGLAVIYISKKQVGSSDRGGERRNS